MILVDTSVWIDHFRHGNAALQSLLEDGRVLTHPFVIGELACGALSDREEILGLLATLPQATVADHAEALALVRERRLPGRGIGWIDVHLLASALLTTSPLWTLDVRLARAAAALRNTP